MIREIPILYSTPMIQAKLAGRKTQTRRIMKVQPDNECYFEMRITEVNAGFGCIIDYNQGHENPFIKCPYGKPGDLLYARETTGRQWRRDAVGGTSTKTIYKADGTELQEGMRWTPSLHMPKIAARIWDRVVSVRVERLQDISEEDAIAEGIEELLQSRAQRAENGRMFRDYSKKPEMFNDGVSAKKSYETLWLKINGPSSWEFNPWVWVITTETLSTTGRP